MTPVRKLERRPRSAVQVRASQQNESAQKSSATKLQKIRFTVRMPPVVVQTPANIPQPSRYESFRDFIDRDTAELQEGDDLLTPQKITEEAQVRNRVNQSRAVNANLEQELRQAPPERQREPRQYSHHDHLVAHALHFRKLLRAEYQKHKVDARKVAYEAARQGRARLPKSAEELERELIEIEMAKYRQVVKDIARFWNAVAAEVSAMRQAQFDKIEQARRLQRFEQEVEKHTQMLQPKIITESTSSSDDDGDNHDGDETDASSTGSSVTNESSMQEEEDMSTSNSEDDPDVNMNDDVDADAALSADQLRQKYANLKSVTDSLSPVKVLSSPAAASSQVGSPKAKAIELEAVDQSLLEDDSNSIDTDDGEDSDESDVEEESGDEDGVDDSDPTLLSLFAPSEVADVSRTEPQQYTAESEVQVSRDSDSASTNRVERVETPDERRRGVEEGQKTIVPVDAVPENLHQDFHSVDTSTPASVQTSMTNVSEGESLTSTDARADTRIMALAPKASQSKLKTPVPSLLRGKLREYQHEGLDWLANLYANGRNGILADEMGLGKTIQTIALLAHLAVQHHVWGPHLIVVPSSVLLNWEMEFKKFCPGFRVLVYYGSINERKQKRRGWMDDDLWHVIITTYQIVLQDHKNLKRRNWHYMVLDEAHNIKNFRSQRWQTMLTFKTRARLLLTGTPLQNSLQELWSLLFFLRPTDMAEDEDDAFAGLSDFSEWFRKPVDQILDQGRTKVDKEAAEQIDKLHKVIRPYLLRRLKAEVEKQMPAKYEHIELCRLSKRQRQLYDEFMSRTKTRDTLASGNYFSIIDCLMQLRKVCNHPDLFETRPITTSFAMSKPAAADLEVSDLLVRRKMLARWDESVNQDFLRLAPVSDERRSAIEAIDCSKLQAYHQLQALQMRQRQRLSPASKCDQSSVGGVLSALKQIGRQARFGELQHCLYQEFYRHQGRPIYGKGLQSRLTLPVRSRAAGLMHDRETLPAAWNSISPDVKRGWIQSVEDRAVVMQPLIQRFACITPVATALGLAKMHISEAGAKIIRQSRDLWVVDPFHEARTRLAIAFPDKRLLQYDCGKLQRLDKLLRRLHAEGHRALIFTQMTKVLDILEQFLNIHGHRYLRLDGSTKIEQRQILTERFNNDPQFLVFILSSRSGGLGINLTGADTVIFYDLDWNPAMDKQCQDRCHRIGQTRDVHIYRFVSEHTIESNILRKSNQKRLLDNVVIQEGDFTTDYLERRHADDHDKGTAAALDKVLGGAKGQLGAVFQEAEDREDVQAAQDAQKEDENADVEDFGHKPSTEDHHEARDENAVSTSMQPENIDLTPGTALTTPALPNAHNTDEIRGSGRPFQDNGQNELSANTGAADSASSLPSSLVPPSSWHHDRPIHDIDSWVLAWMIQCKNEEYGEIKPDDTLGEGGDGGGSHDGGREKNGDKCSFVPLDILGNRNKSKNKKKKGGIGGGHSKSTRNAEHRVRRIK